MSEVQTPDLDTSLPEGFTFVGSDNLDPSDIIRMHETREWEGDTPERWQQCLNQALATVGVRGPDGKLVGLGRLAGDVRHAVLVDLVVHPDHRKKGIGTAIVNRRMQIAEERGVKFMYTSLAEDNYLRPIYEKMGFIATGDTYFLKRDK